MKTNRIALEEVSSAPYAEAVALFRQYINPGLVDLLDPNCKDVKDADESS